jgi:hypothetical protein
MLTLLLPVSVSGQDDSLSYHYYYHCSEDLDSLDGLPIYTIADKMPEYPGGEEARIKFFIENIHYPEIDSSDAAMIQSTVYGSFIIDTSGSLIPPISLIRLI